MSEQPLFMQMAQDAVTKEDERLQRADEKRNQERQERERKQDLEQGAELTLALKTILGQDAANEILAGRELTGPEVTHGNYTFWYRRARVVPKTPFGNQPTEGGLAHRFAVERKLPEDMREWYVNHITTNEIETPLQLGYGLRSIDAEYASVVAGIAQRKASEERERAWRETPEPEVEIAVKAQPELDWETQNNIAYLERLTAHLKSGGKPYGADGLILAWIEYLRYAGAGIED